MKTRYKLGLLASLYISQGLPQGFFTQALPALLRHHNISLAAIGLTSLLSLTWALKFLWSPLVDQFGSNRFGYRKSWIVPLQLLAVLLLSCTSLVDPNSALMIVVFMAFGAKLIAATQDVATDALAIDLLKPEERGVGNGVQIAGYRVGMIVGGGVLLMVYGWVGWANTFLTLGALLMVGVMPISLYREPAHPVRPAVASFKHQYLTMILDSFRRPQIGLWLIALMTFKAGDALESAMLRPYLIDRGLRLADIGWMLGTVGFSAGLLGAVVGGGAINRLGRTKSLVVFGLMHALSMFLYALSAAGIGSTTLLYGLCAIEYFAGSLVTVALCTHMMDRSRPEASATDYTVQASTLAVAVSMIGSTSGFLAQSLGYRNLFALASLLGLSGVVVFLIINNRTPASARRYSEAAS